MIDLRKLRNRLAWHAAGFAVFLLLVVLSSAPAQAQTLTVLHNFDLGADGGSPFSGVTLDQQGRIYGTTSDGGSRNGVVYRLVRGGSGWILTPIHTFQGRPDGASPYGRVVFGPDGTLYGTTFYGGATGNGIVFRLQPPATSCRSSLCPWVETILYSFSGGSDGGNPYLGDLTFDQAGNIYGTTYGGGRSGDGVVFKLTHSGSGWSESVLWNFTGNGDGSYPESGVVFDRAGNLYGATSFGGDQGYGTVYELSPSTGWSEKTLYSFTESDGGYGVGGLIMDAAEDLFGVTGNPGLGAAFELTPSNGNWTFSLLQSFTGTYPGPFTTPTLDSHGNLYGAVATGGRGSVGEIFKLTPGGSQWSYTPYHDFRGNEGEYPLGAVTFDASGNMYGTTLMGGTSTWGTVWEITP